MNKNNSSQKSVVNFTQVLDAAIRLPYVRINREDYLRSALQRYCTAEQMEEAIKSSPAAAGIPLETIKQIANSAIKHETSRVTGISALTGIPGGIAMVGSIPTDLAQYTGHMLRISQKLAYLYSWPDLFGADGEMDEATSGVLTLFLGTMFGLNAANNGIKTVSNMLAKTAARRLPRQALTQGVVYPVVKKVSLHLGVKMTKGVFANGVAKAIPLAGAVLSGGLTLASFLPMAKRLEKHLATLETTKPDFYKEAASESSTEID